MNENRREYGSKEAGKISLSRFLAFSLFCAIDEVVCNSVTMMFIFYGKYIINPFFPYFQNIIFNNDLKR